MHTVTCEPLAVASLHSCIACLISIARHGSPSPRISPARNDEERSCVVSYRTLVHVEHASDAGPMLDKLRRVPGVAATAPRARNNWDYDMSNAAAQRLIEGPKSMKCRCCRCGACGLHVSRATTGCTSRIVGQLIMSRNPDDQIWPGIGGSGLISILASLVLTHF